MLTLVDRELSILPLLVIRGYSFTGWILRDVYTPIDIPTFTTFVPYFAPKVVPSAKNFTQTKRLWRLSLTMTPNTQIEAVYLLKTTSDALIESLATEAASCLRNHLPRTHPCLLVRAKIVESDSTSNSSSPLSPVKSISLPKGAAPQRWL